MRIYNFRNYREYLKARIEDIPNKRHGEIGRLARAAETQSSVISQVFQEKRHLTEEQAIGICDYLGISQMESEFFLLLVRYSRAGTHRLRKLLLKQIESISAEEGQLSKRLPKIGPWSEEQQILAYAHWYTIAAIVLTDIPAYQTVDAIAQRLNVPRGLIQKSVDQLVASGSCKVHKNRISVAIPDHPFLSETSPIKPLHLTNWRLKAIEKHPQLSKNREMAISSPMTLSAAKVSEVFELLAKTVDDVFEVSDTTKPEVTYCLNIDWFEF